MVLGGWGLVGAAICRKVLEFSPSKLIITSLKKSEAEDTVRILQEEFPNKDPKMFVAKGGNIFTRDDWRNENWMNVIDDDVRRMGAIEDIFMELDGDILRRSALYQMIQEEKPDVVIDCINTATAFAYLDTYRATLEVVNKIKNDKLDNVSVERLIVSTYIPQLIRHVQILHKSLTDAESTLYLKVGTSGTGGMGLNIPYTHSEERPSRVLMSKSALAGAQTMLLYLMARTPGGPIVKEIKPTAAIAWKRIAYDTVMRKGSPIMLMDMDIESARSVDNDFRFDDNHDVIDRNKEFKSVFIDTGENGIFSRGEFQAISSLGQMEIVTPEEIAEYVVYELRGGNTGYEVMQGLDSFTLGPTYRGGMLQNVAIRKIKQLEKEHGVDSIAFELLGPPRLSKLLIEAYLIKKIAKSMAAASGFSKKELAKKALELIREDEELRSQILSIGLVILFPDGENYIRGDVVNIPVKRETGRLEINKKRINQWCYEGWIDLRPSNFLKWKERIDDIIKHSNLVPLDETSSRYTYTKDYWDNYETIDPGKIAGWIFEFEDKGWRFKR